MMNMVCGIVFPTPQKKKFTEKLIAYGNCNVAAGVSH